MSKFCMYTLEQHAVIAHVYISAVGYVPMTRRARTVLKRYNSQCYTEHLPFMVSSLNDLLSQIIY